MDEVEQEDQKLRGVFLPMRVEPSPLEPVDEFHESSGMEDDPLVLFLLAFPKQTKLVFFLPDDSR